MKQTAITYSTTSEWHSLCVQLVRVDHSKLLGQGPLWVSNDGVGERSTLTHIRLNILYLKNTISNFKLHTQVSCDRICALGHKSILAHTCMPISFLSRLAGTFHVTMIFQVKYSANNKMHTVGQLA